MAFNDLLASQAPGMCWLLDVVNGAGTVLYRYGSGSVVTGGNRYDGRLLEVGAIVRGFANNGMPAPGTVDLVLDNADNGVDWLVDRATVASAVFSCRFRLYLGLWDASASYAAHPTLTTRQCGEYVCLDFPQRDSDGRVRLTLADDSMGRLADLAQAPTLNDWSNDIGTSPTNNPVGSFLVPQKLGNWDAPIQLAFGSKGIKLQNAVLERYGLFSSTPWNNWQLIYPICVTTETGTPTLGDVVTRVYLDIVDLGVDFGMVPALRGRKALLIPSTGPNGPEGSTIWSLHRSHTLFKSGKNWQVLWLKFNTYVFEQWLWKEVRPNAVLGAISGSDDPVMQGVYRLLLGALQDRLVIEGYPWSARTVDFRAQQHPVDIVRDLISYYSLASASDIDSTSFARAKDAQINLNAGGVVQSTKSVVGGVGVGEARVPEWNGGHLRTVLGEICASSDMELFSTWLGKFALSVDSNDFAAQTDTLPELDEERILSVTEVIPSQGQRHAPYNRLWVDMPEGEPLGPFDNEAAITAWGNRILARRIKASWTVPTVLGSFNPWTSRLVESSVRSTFRVATGLDGLRFELGDLLTFSWTRGGTSGPYAGAIARVDAIDFDYASGRTVLTLLWKGDLRDEQPFLLDDEDLLEVASNTSPGTRTATVQDGDDEVVFSSGDFSVDGVLPGDFLVLLDATLGATDFRRFRALKVLQRLASDRLQVADSDGSGYDFGAASPVAVTNWVIRRGFETYPDSATDPTNYPSDGDMYGKVSDDAGEYTGSVPANQLQNG